MEAILQAEHIILSPHLEAIGLKTAAWIWAFISKFVMLDCLSQVLGAAEVHPGLPVPRKTCSADYLGTIGKVNTFVSKYIHLLTGPSDPGRAQPTNKDHRQIF